MPGYSLLGTLLDTTGDKLKHNVQLQDDWRKQKSEFLIDALHAVDDQGNPKLPPEQANQAWDELSKLHNQPGIKDLINNFRDLHGKLSSMGKKTSPQLMQRNGQQLQQAVSADPNAQAPAAPATPDATQPPAAAPQATTPTLPPRTSMTSMIQSGSPASQKIAETSAQQKAILARTSEAANKEMEDRRAMAGKIGLKEGTPAFAQFVAGHGQLMPSSIAVPKKVGSYVGKDSKVHTIMQHFDPESGGFETYEIDSDNNVRDMRSTLAGAGIAATDVQRRAGQGEKFLDADGNEIDVSRLRPNEELKPWVGDPSMRGRYLVVDQTTKQITADNLVRTYPSLSPDQQTVQGKSKTGTVGTHEVQDTDAAGNPVAVPLVSTSTPITGSMPAAAGPAGTTPPPAATPAPKPAAPGGPRQLGAFQSGERDKQMQIVRPVRTAASYIVGTNSGDPNEESLVSFGKLADDPKSQQRMGTAARMVIRDAAAAANKGEGIGASLLGNGVAFDAGGITKAIENATGITEWIAGTESAATKSAVGALTEEEQRALNQMIAAYGTIVGLRKITSGGAYQFSLASMERELPMPGFSGVTGSKSYYNKLATLMKEPVEGSKGISDQLLPEKKFYESEYRRLLALGKGTSTTSLPDRESQPGDRVPVIGPKGETGTMKKGGKLPKGWTVSTPKPKTK